MASTYRVLISHILFLLLISCSNEGQKKTDPEPEVALLECKPIQWPDGSTSYSIYATIGTNQTKVANAAACEPIEPEKIKDLFPNKQIVSLLDCTVGDTTLFFFLEKIEGGLKVIQSEGSDSADLVVTTFKNGKFFFN